MRTTYICGWWWKSKGTTVVWISFGVSCLFKKNGEIQDRHKINDKTIDTHTHTTFSMKTGYWSIFVWIIFGGLVPFPVFTSISCRKVRCVRCTHTHTQMLKNVTNIVDLSGDTRQTFQICFCFYWCVKESSHDMVNKLSNTYDFIHGFVALHFAE